MAEEVKAPPKEKIPRQPMPEQEPKVRARNFQEVPLGYTKELAMKEAQRCIQCKDPRCRQGCPVEIEIPAFIKCIKEGDFEGAIRKLWEKNSLPAVCGRVCPQEVQCEGMCIVGKKDAPVAIGNLERFAADYQRKHGKDILPPKPEPTGKKVAVVGAGPAGLTVAGDLIQKGHEVHMFEALHGPGGVLLYGIPEFRLPKAIVAQECNFLERMGVKIEVNAVIGRSETVDELLENFDAVFLGVGAGLPVFLKIPGEHFIGVYSANEYLTRSNLMKAYTFPENDTPIVKGKNVATFGGGNVAMDGARTALRLGAEHSYIIYRRSHDELPARSAEVHHAEEEGVEFLLLTNPLRFLGDERGPAHRGGVPAPGTGRARRLRAAAARAHPGLRVHRGDRHRGHRHRLRLQPAAHQEHPGPGPEQVGLYRRRPQDRQDHETEGLGRRRHRHRLRHRHPGHGRRPPGRQLHP